MIYASGGIVWKRVSGSYKIALVSGKRQDEVEWSLPKGKLKTEESWEAAAIRAVKEKTGHSARILEYANTINYIDDGTPAVASFWHMKVTGKSLGITNPDILEMDWFSPKEALQKIKYEEQKEILAGIEIPKDSITKKTALFFRKYNPFKFLKLLFRRGARYKRLEGNIHTFRQEYSQWSDNKKSAGWASRVRHLLYNSEKELQSGDIDVAWKNFHGAKRLFLFGLSHQELINEAHVIRIEAAKLNEWRRNATYKLIGEPDHPVDNKQITPELLIKATHIRDEHYTNQYYKNQLLREVYKVLLFAMLVLVGCISVYLWLLGFMNPATDTPGSTTDFYASVENWLLLGIILFGMLGGCISAIFHIRNSSDKTRIPEIVSNNYVTTIRVFIGAALALIIYVFLQSGFVDQIFEIEIKPTDPFTYFAIAFVAGFTERLVLRAINSVVGEN